MIVTAGDKSVAQETFHGGKTAIIFTPTTVLFPITANSEIPLDIQEGQANLRRSGKASQKPEKEGTRGLVTWLLDRTYQLKYDVTCAHTELHDGWRHG